MGIPPQLHTEVHHVNQRVIMVLMEPRVKEGSMGTDKGVPPPGIMRVTADSLTADSLTEDSLMEDIMDTTLLQVTSLLVLTKRHTSGSTPLTRTTVASSTARS